jgi:hypothetical protein
MSQLQCQRILPVHASPHRIHGLPVGEALGKLQQGGQRQSGGSGGGLAAWREQSGKLLILEQGAERIRTCKARQPFGKAARATRSVSAGIRGGPCGWSDMRGTR